MFTLGDEEGGMTSEDSCTESEGRHSSLSPHIFAEDQTDYLEEKREPGIVAVFNGKELNISEELITEALSGISVKHYEGSCLPREEISPDGGYLLGEDYLDYEDEYPAGGVESKAMSSMIRLCYEPKKRGSAMSDNVPEDMSDYRNKPLCLQEQINFRNSFWDLHRPELCKLTWPHAYVGEAIVTEHLHRHLRKHGAICAGFHEQRDMTAMLDKELDLYDKLKMIQSPREVPPDEEAFSTAKGGRKPRKMKYDPCRPPFKPPPIREDNDDDLNPSQVIRPSKEEFCITIGRPLRRKTIRDERTGRIESKIWLPYDEGVFEGPGEYTYPDYCSESTYSSEMIDCVAEGEGEMAEEAVGEESETSEPPGWVEPDFCAI